MDTRIWNIIGNHLKEEASVDDMATLNKWLNESAENAAMLEDITKIWEKTGSLDYSKWAPKVDIDEEWNAFRKMKSEDNDPKPDEESLLADQKHKSISWSTWIYRVAAILILGSGILYYVSPDQSTSSGNIIVHATAQEKTKISLPDGSEVWLNSKSEISYDENFGITHRSLALNGEAYFDIQKDQKPFIISSKQAKTEVLGTAFNLRSYEGENQTELTLIRGSVSFSEKENPTNQVILIPGEKAVLKQDSKEIYKTELSDNNFLAWKEEVLAFNKTKLRDVASTLEKYFGVTIRVSQEQLYNCRFTGKFNQPKLREILNVLTASLNLEYTIIDDLVSIKGQGCTAD